MMLSLTKAAKTGHVAKTTLQNALERGDISASKNDKGHWQIDKSELGRWLSNRSVELDENDDENGGRTHDETEAEHVSLRVENEVLKERVKGLEAQLSKSEEVADKWEQAFLKQQETAANALRVIEDKRGKEATHEGTPQATFWARLFRRSG